MTDIDSTLMKKVFDVAQRLRKSNVDHRAKLDDLGRCFEIAERRFGHFLRLRLWNCLLKPVCSDTAAKAIRYALGRLPHLEACLSNRHLEIDNNAAELGMRGMAVGRKICSLQAPMAEEST